MALREWTKLIGEKGGGGFASGESGAFIKVFVVDVGTVASVTANSTIEADFAVPGLFVGDTILATEKPTHQAGIGIVGARVKAADILSIQYMNTTAGGVVPTDEDYKVTVLRINA